MSIIYLALMSAWFALLAVIGLSNETASVADIYGFYVFIVLHVLMILVVVAYLVKANLKICQQKQEADEFENVIESISEYDIGQYDY